jgi:hypothetical protein
MKALRIRDKYAIYRVSPDKEVLNAIVSMLEDPEVASILLLKDETGIIALVDKHGQEFVNMALQIMYEAIQNYIEERGWSEDQEEDEDQDTRDYKPEDLGEDPELLEDLDELEEHLREEME